MFSLCLCLRLCDCNDVSAVGEVQERSDVAGWICRLFLSYSPYSALVLHARRSLPRAILSI